ncbi:MAG: hypothetical protein EA353_10140 [Puniceicoccaceae bacterium]|nr:MAG: hypothetical protein EA353_10140 [Puniceicoccaceae bacterium]
MHSDDDLQTTLSKWPFILGDVLLVATALAIAILGDWQLTNWQVAACVVSVALGAGLFVLPYIVEYYVRVREEAEDRSSELRLIKRHLGDAESQLAAIDERMAAFEATAESVFGRVGHLEPRIERMEAQDQDWDASVKGLEQSFGAKVEPLLEARALQQAELDALSAKVAALTDSLNAPVEAAEPAVEAAEPAVEAAEPPVEVAEPPNEVAEPPAGAAPEVDTVDAANVADASDAPDPAPDASDAANPEIDSAAEVEVDAAAEVEVDSVDESVEVDHKAAVSRPVRATRQRRQMEPRLLQRAIETKKDGQSLAVSRIITGKLKPAQNTAVVAAVFIGIGNKPYVRGSGGGLSWETGVPMEFEAIGKWRWVAPADLDEPIEIQLFRNDEDPDAAGKSTLKPGQQLNLSPVF